MGMENMNIIQTGSISVFSCAVEGQRSPDHQEGHVNDALKTIEGSSALLLECTALLSPSPPPSAQRSRLL